MSLMYATKNWDENVKKHPVAYGVSGFGLAGVLGSFAIVLAMLAMSGKDLILNRPYLFILVGVPTVVGIALGIAARSAKSPAWLALGQKLFWVSMVLMAVALPVLRWLK